MPLPRISNKLANIAKSTLPANSSSSFYDISKLGLEVKDSKTEETVSNKKRSYSTIKKEELNVKEERKQIKKETSKNSSEESQKKKTKVEKKIVKNEEGEEQEEKEPIGPTTNEVAATARHWVVKSEPHVYGIDHIKNENIGLGIGVGVWDGVHNYQARNFMKLFKRGDLLYFYHSNCAVPGIYGTMRVTEEHSPDPTALDPNHRNFDKRIKSKDLNPWVKVGVKFIRKVEEPLTLTMLKEIKALETNILVKRGNRLSVMPLSEEQNEAIWNKLKEINNIEDDKELD